MQAHCGGHNRSCLTIKMCSWLYTAAYGNDSVAASPANNNSGMTCMLTGAQQVAVKCSVWQVMLHQHADLQDDVGVGRATSLFEAAA